MRAPQTAKTVLVANQKGGVGKSLIADELAFSFERTGLATSFADLDGQGGTLHPTEQVPFADVLVVDTPGALQADMGAWMAQSDVLVIPTRPTTVEVPTLLRMVELAEASFTGELLVVVNCADRFTMTSAFLKWFSENLPDVRMVTLPQAIAFQQAHALGKSVVEYEPRSKAAWATLAMVNRVRALLGFAPERPAAATREQLISSNGGSK